MSYFNEGAGESFAPRDGTQIYDDSNSKLNLLDLINDPRDKTSKPTYQQKEQEELLVAGGLFNLEITLPQLRLPTLPELPKIEDIFRNIQKTTGPDLTLFTYRGGYETREFEGTPQQFIPEAARDNLIRQGIIAAGLEVTEERVQALRKLIDRESTWRPFIGQTVKDENSGSNAAFGLTQITPTTWKELVAAYPNLLDDRRNPVAQIAGALLYCGEHYPGREARGLPICPTSGY